MFQARRFTSTVVVLALLAGLVTVVAPVSAATTPPAPRGVVLTAGVNAVTLSWQAPVSVQVKQYCFTLDQGTTQLELLCTASTASSVIVTHYQVGSLTSPLWAGLSYRVQLYYTTAANQPSAFAAWVSATPTGTPRAISSPAQAQSALNNAARQVLGAYPQVWDMLLLDFLATRAGGTGYGTPGCLGMLGLGVLYTTPAFATSLYPIASTWYNSVHQGATAIEQLAVQVLVSAITGDYPGAEALDLITQETLEGTLSSYVKSTIEGSLEKYAEHGLTALIDGSSIGSRITQWVANVSLGVSEVEGSVYDAIYYLQTSLTSGERSEMKVCGEYT